MRKYPTNKGFTLIELMVAGTIAVGLMVGLSTFFAGGFKSILQTREKVSDSQGQFDVAKNLTSEFSVINDLDTNNTCNNECVVALNDMENGNLPFTYIGINQSDKIVVRDFFVFNGKEDSVSSQDRSGEIENPGGLTKLNNEYYITAPLEDAIYKCPLTGGLCTDLVINGLDKPMDITNDGTDLYVTDAGTNRIVKIDIGRNTVDEVASGFNFPTGIEYYKPDYLFVADTYNHEVKKVKISDGTSDVVVGNGDDEVCNNDGRDHSAIFCKLSFPTGLMINAGELYIADTGNGRVLKVSDPGYPSDFTMDFLSPGTDEAIKEIKIVFPAGTNHGGTTLDSVISADLDEDGNTSYSAETFVYELWTTLNQDTAVTNDQPDPTPDTKNVIRVDNGALLEANDVLILSNDANNDFEVDAKLSATRMRLKTDFNSHHNFGEKVILTTPVPADTGITFDLSGVDTSGTDSGFRKIDIEMYDETDTLLETRTHTIRIGDGELGTPEDTISVMPGSYTFPTGLGWNVSLDVGSGLPEYSTDFINYDYTSDFEVRNFIFTKKNAGNLLELEFEAMTGKDTEGNKIWEDLTLNADITP